MNRFRRIIDQIREEDLKPAYQQVRQWRDPTFDALEMIFSRVFGFGGYRTARWAVMTAFLGLVWIVAAMAPTEKAPAGIPTELAIEQVQFVFCHVRALVVSTPQEGALPHVCDRLMAPNGVRLEPLAFEIPFQRLFRAGVLQHILVMAFAGWLAFQVAAHFLAELFSLPDTSCAEHYLLQSAWINPYNTLHIRNDEISLGERNLPVSLIGGPGEVCVHAEFAALFEKKDGSPRVIGPSVHKYPSLDGFERLRKAIDLRDHEESLPIEGRSQDGIRIKVKDLRVVYSVFRGQEKPTFERPFPFQDPDAIEKLIYLQNEQVWYRELCDQIKGSLLDFFAEHLLTEFLAMVNDPEYQKNQQYEYELIKEAQRQAGFMGNIPQPPLRRIEGIDYQSRPKITNYLFNRFYTRSLHSQVARGMQIDWIGAGTWDFPKTIAARHQEAWRMAHDNQGKSSPAAFKHQQNQKKVNEILHLVRMMPIGVFKEIQKNRTLRSDEAMFRLTQEYSKIMREAINEYDRLITEYTTDILQQNNSQVAQELSIVRAQLETDRKKVYEVVTFLAYLKGHWPGGEAPGTIHPDAPAPGSPNPSPAPISPGSQGPAKGGTGG
jgi:hypothetical protein